MSVNLQRRGVKRRMMAWEFDEGRGFIAILSRSTVRF
jgi:hypothetical protein